MALEEYNRKRKFDETSEPEGQKKASGKKLVFVVQRHAATRLHYDLRLEMDGVLKSWAVPKGPSMNPDDKRLAMMVEDHPYSYRTFEGRIPEGNYGAGMVEIWDEGTYEPIEKKADKKDDLIMRSDLHKGSLKIIFHGKKLKGEFALVKIKNNEEDNAWLLIKHNDKFATNDDYDAEEHTAEDSEVTRYLEEKSRKKKKSNNVRQFKHYAPGLAKEKKLSDVIKPMLCKVADSPFTDEEWGFEIKWDGYRALADLREDEPKLYSRNGLDFSRRFAKIHQALKLQPYEMVLDGEIVAYDSEGRASFQRLQNLEEYAHTALQYQVFDLLWLNGHATHELRYIQRKELLRNALAESDLIQYHDFVRGEGKQFFNAAERLGLEGIIAKKLDSLYTQNLRSSEWLKIKMQKTDEVLICGYTQPKGSRMGFGSLILGKYVKNKIVFCGHTGTGFSDKILRELYKKMQPYIQEHSIFDITPKTNDRPTWLQPTLVAEIKYTELTRDRIYRHPVFLHLREDIDPAKVRFDHSEDPKPKIMTKKASPSKSKSTDINKKIGGQVVKLTNQDKIYYPDDGITKGDVVAYYQSISKYILPHLKSRPQSMNRYPNGIDGMSFYQKDAADETPDWIRIEQVYSESSDKNIDYIICDDKATLAYLNNLGCIEMNVWTSKIEKADYPSYLVLDLDPSEKNSFDDVIETAQAVREVLDRVDLPSYPKTSGSSGIHVYIPTGGKYEFEQVKNFGHLLMQLVHQMLPKITTLERNLKKRGKNKIYLDYLQNRRGQTLASVYSLRPKPGAPVSMPLEWSEVKKGLSPADFHIGNALDRLKEKGDLFKPVLGKGIDMLKAIKKLENQ